LSKQITYRSLLQDALKFRSHIVLGQSIALFVVLVSLPIPLLFPLLIDQVLLHKPAQLTSLIDTLFAPSQPWGYVLIVLFTTLLLRLIFMVTNIYQLRLFTLISKHLVYKIRKKILNHLGSVSVAEYESLGGGGVSAKMVTDIDTVDAFIGVSIGRAIVSVLSLIGIAIILLYINYQLALMILILNPTIIAITNLLARRIRRLKKDENSQIEKFQNRLSETLDLFVQIRTYNQESRYIAKMAQDAASIKKASSAFGWKSEAASQGSAFLFLSGFEFFRAASMVMVLSSSLSIGEMFAVIGYLWFMVTPLQDLLNIVFSYQNATVALTRLNALLDLKKEPSYPHIHNPFKDQVTNAITLKNINFSYASTRVLHDINMHIPHGKTVALIGHSGSGKTTLAHLILGLYAPESGSIYIDNVPVEQIGLDVVRSHVALVLQSPKMFNDTLRQNLTLGRNIDDSTIEQALKIAQLSTLVSKLPEALETMIGKDGVRLSGGERQRVSIARMILHSANIILLDESTSALDTTTESDLFRSMREHLMGKTTLIIAHRQSTIEHADLIYVLKNGRIIQHGEPKDLREEDGYYKNFVLS